MRKIFIDGGAHRGSTFTDYLERDARFDGWTIMAIEPSPENLQPLLDKAAAVSGRYNVEIYPFALGGKSAVRPFYLKANEGRRGDSIFEETASDHATVNEARSYRLHVATVDVVEFILAHTAPDDEIVLKLDVEGAEFEILPRLLSSPDTMARVRRVLVEWHTIGRSPTDATAGALRTQLALAGPIVEDWPH